MTIMTVAGSGELESSNSVIIFPTNANGAWVIHNIYVDNGSTVKIEVGDVFVDMITGSLLSCYIHLTNNIQTQDNQHGWVYHTLCIRWCLGGIDDDSQGQPGGHSGDIMTCNQSIQNLVRQ